MQEEKKPEEEEKKYDSPGTPEHTPEEETVTDEGEKGDEKSPLAGA